MYKDASALQITNAASHFMSIVGAREDFLMARDQGPCLVPLPDGIAYVVEKTREQKGSQGPQIKIKRYANGDYRCEKGLLR